MSSRIALFGAFLCAAMACVRAHARATPDPILCWATQSLGTRPRLLVDLRLRSGNANRQPSADDVRAITALGGAVVHQFNVAVVRAAVDTAALRQLLGARTGIADVAYPVADSTTFDTRVQVFYRRLMTPSDDSALTALGATSFWRPAKSRTASVTLPDSAIPDANRLADVDFVRAQTMACGIINGATSSAPIARRDQVRGGGHARNNAPSLFQLAEPLPRHVVLESFYSPVTAGHTVVGNT